MERQIKRVCVYCASSNHVAAPYFEAAAALGRQLAESGATVVYGGGRSGLMGRLADAALDAGGKVVGIIPHFMKAVEWQHEHLSELHLVDDMHERKKRFLVEVDALVALPGGCGTFEELMEAITLKRLGLFTKPIVILNLNGYYDPLLLMLERAVEERFMRPEHRQMWTSVAQAEDILEAIRSAPPWSQEAIGFAAV
jgi:hypothetical protein